MAVETIVLSSATQKAARASEMARGMRVAVAVVVVLGGFSTSSLDGLSGSWCLLSVDMSIKEELD